MTIVPVAGGSYGAGSAIIAPTFLGAEGNSNTGITLSSGAMRTAGAYVVVESTNFSTTVPSLQTGTGITFFSLGTGTGNSNAFRLAYAVIPPGWDGAIGGDGTRMQACVYSGVTSVQYVNGHTNEGSGSPWNFYSVTGLSVARTIGRFLFGAQDEAIPSPASAVQNVATVTPGFSRMRYADFNGTAWSPAAGASTGYQYLSEAVIKFNDP